MATRYQLGIRERPQVLSCGGGWQKPKQWARALCAWNWRNHAWPMHDIISCSIQFSHFCSYASMNTGKVFYASEHLCSNIYASKHLGTYASMQWCFYASMPLCTPSAMHLFCASVHPSFILFIYLWCQSPIHDSMSISCSLCIRASTHPFIYCLSVHVCTCTCLCTCVDVNVHVVQVCAHGGRLLRALLSHGQGLDVHMYMYVFNFILACTCTCSIGVLNPSVNPGRKFSGHSRSIFSSQIVFVFYVSTILNGWRVGEAWPSLQSKQNHIGTAPHRLVSPLSSLLSPLSILSTYEYSSLLRMFSVQLLLF